MFLKLLRLQDTFMWFVSWIETNNKQTDGGGRIKKKTRQPCGHTGMLYKSKDVNGHTAIVENQTKTLYKYLPEHI